jgi:hypothetical protein
MFVNTVANMMVIFLLIVLGCSIALIVAPIPEEYVVGLTIEQTSELGRSEDCVPMTDSENCIPNYTSPQKSRKAVRRAAPQDCATNYTETGSCGNIPGCKCRCAEYIQKYRAVGIYTLTPTDKDRQKDVQFIKSTTDYIYTSAEDALNHAFSRSALGKTGHFPSRSTLTDLSFDNDDLVQYDPDTMHRYISDLSICVGVFAGAFVFSGGVYGYLSWHNRKQWVVHV